MKRKSFIIIFVCLILIITLGLAIPTLTAKKSSDFGPVIWQNPNNYQRTGSIMVVADIRLFTTMSIFNTIYHYDIENAAEFYPLRTQIRAELQKRLSQISPDKIAEWSKFYTKKNMHIYHYIDYTMSLSGEYPFQKINTHSGGILTQLDNYFSKPRGFEKIMNDFWLTLDLQNLWDEAYPEYIAEMKKFDIQQISKEEKYVWQYVKMEKILSGKTLVSIPNLLDSYYSAFGVEYPGYYFTISSPGSHNYGLNIHEYLHGVIGPLVEKHYKKYKEKFEPYFIEARKSEQVKNNYNHFKTFIEECLVRAMDPRIRYHFGITPNWQMISQEIVDTKTLGLNLVPIFFVLLEEFEESPKGFNDFIIQIFDQVPHLKDIQ